ncbi:MAG: hypothetical protein ACJA0N_000223 [Pseudohongiellaceae bacterium]|jgi:hypothetical protein
MPNITHLLELFNDLHKYCLTQAQFTEQPLSESDEQFISRLKALAGGELTQEDIYEKGQYFIEGIIANYPMITPVLNRDILWLLGGNCMHFMADEEIQKYQALDEIFYQAQQQDKPISYQEAKAQAFHLH